MCGLVGIIDDRNARDHIKPMLESLRSRGPDEVSYAHAPWYSLAFCRLSIVALDTGHQPVSNAAGSINLAFNGEIYNYPFIRKRLHSLYGVSVSSEAEALLCAYERQGPSFAADLDGDFAIAVLDSRCRSCFLYRDPYGVKPLYYAALARGVWAFSSHPAAFFQHPDFSTDFDMVALTEQRVLSFWSTHRTCFEKIHQLPPGHRFSFTASERDGTSTEPTLTRFVPDFPAEPVDEASWAETPSVRCGRLLRRAASKRVFHADVGPVVLALSGGVDSSLLAAVAGQSWSGRVEAVTIYDDDSSDDRHYATEVARGVGLRHQERKLRLAEFLDALPQMILAFAAPKPSYTPYLLGLAVRQCYPTAKVLLCGEGADEFFLGYSLLQDFQGFITRALDALAMQPRELTEASELLQRVDRWAGASNEEVQRDLVDMFQAEQLVSSHLIPFDHGPMAHGVECRVPFLDQELLQHVRSLPDHLKVFNGHPKQLLRDLLAAALEEQPLLAHHLLTRAPSPAFFAVSSCRASLERLLAGHLDDSRLAHSDLAGFARGAESLFWLAGIRSVFLEHKGRIGGMTFEALWEEVLGDERADAARLDEVIE